jgi:hypothetical protein
LHRFPVGEAWWVGPAGSFPGESRCGGWACRFSPLRHGGGWELGCAVQAQARRSVRFPGRGRRSGDRALTQWSSAQELVHLGGVYSGMPACAAAIAWLRDGQPAEAVHRAARRQSRAAASKAVRAAGHRGARCRLPGSDSRRRPGSRRSPHVVRLAVGLDVGGAPELPVGSVGVLVVDRERPRCGTPPGAPLAAEALALDKRRRCRWGRALRRSRMPSRWCPGRQERTKCTDIQAVGGRLRSGGRPSRRRRRRPP